jgi:hypothetical protein
MGGEEKVSSRWVMPSAEAERAIDCGVPASPQLRGSIGGLPATNTSRPRWRVLERRGSFRQRLKEDDLSITHDVGRITARRTVRTENSYRDAERAVDRLSDTGFDVGKVTIVGTGLRYVEAVSGRVTTWRAAGMGLLQGGAFGLIFGSLFGFFVEDTADYFAVVLYGLGVGALWGALVGAVLHLAQGGRRDFASQASTQAEQYEIQVDESVADDALGLLDTGAEARSALSARPSWD